MKKINYIFWIIGILIVIGVIRNSFSNNTPKPEPQTVNQFLAQTQTSIPAPTATPTLDQRQQCLDNANTMVGNQQKDADLQWQYAHQFHTGYTSIQLEKSAFSNSLNTCVAEIQKFIVQDGTGFTTTYVYDTLSDKILAQFSFDSNMSKSNFVRFNFKPTYSVLSDFETSIGL